MAAWDVVKKAINSNIEKPLNKLIDEFYNKWYNANYRPDVYLQHSYSETISYVSGEQSKKYETSSTYWRVADIVMPPNCYKLKITARMKNSSSSGYTYFYLAKGYVDIHNYGTSIERVDVKGNSYKEADLTVYPEEFVAGDTISLVIGIVESGTTGYWDKIDVEYFYFEKVTTDELFKIGERKTRFSTTTQLYLDVFPLESRCDVEYAGSISAMYNTISWDGESYVFRIPSNYMLSVKY